MMGVRGMGLAGVDLARGILREIFLPSLFFIFLFLQEM